MQYREGTVAVTNGNPVVTGTGTAWVGNVTPGSVFTVNGSGVPYIVGSVDSNTQITLNGNYAGSTASGLSYSLTTSYTPNRGFPYPEARDINTDAILKRAMLMLDALLPVWAAGKVLIVDASGNPSAQPMMFANGVINGDFRVWQEGSSFASPANNTYTADQWKVEHDGTIGTFTVSRQTFTIGQTDVPGEPRYFLRWDHTSAGSGSTFRRLVAPIEDVRRYAGQQTVVSFRARADSARSVGVELQQNFGGGGSASVETSLGTAALTDSWQRFEYTVQLPSIAGKTITDPANHTALRFALPLNTTMTIDIADVDVRHGSKGPADFERRPLGVEIQLCERYFQKSFALGTAPAQNVGVDNGEWRVPQVVGATTTMQLGWVSFRVRMRGTPAVTLYNPAAANAQARNISINADCSVTTTEVSADSGFSVRATSPSASAAGNTLGLHWRAVSRF